MKQFFIASVVWLFLAAQASFAQSPSEATSSLRAHDLRTLVAQSKASVVVTGSYHRSRTPAFQARGTGFVVGDGLHVVTAAHVFNNLEGNDIERPSLGIPQANAAGTPEVEVRALALLHIDRAADIAIYRIAEGPPLKPLKLAETPAAEGAPVAIMGFPLGLSLGLFHVTHRGMISAVVPIAIPLAHSSQLNELSIRRLREAPLTVLQLDLTAYPGSSGSPLIDTETGQVVGLLSAGFVKGSKEAAISAPTGISYAIAARQISDALKRAVRP